MCIRLRYQRKISFKILHQNWSQAVHTEHIFIVFSEETSIKRDVKLMSRDFMTAFFLHLVFLNENVLFGIGFRSLVLNYTYYTKLNYTYMILFVSNCLSNVMNYMWPWSTGLKSLRYISSNSQKSLGY